MFKMLITHGMLFSLSKSIVFITPLFAASLLTTESYGLLEWSLSLSMLIATLVSFAAGNTIAFEMVKNKDSAMIHIGKMYSVYLGMFLIILSFIIGVFFNEVAGTILAMSSFLVIQYALSAYIKASGLGARASIVDSGIYTVLLCLLLLIWFNNEAFPSYIEGFLIATVFLSVYLYLIMDTVVAINNKKIIAFFIRGLPIMAASGCAILFFNMPRLLLGSESMLLVGEFSLYFRWAAIAITIHQFLIVVFFRNIYTASHEVFDKIIGGVVISVFLLGFIIILILDFIEEYNIQNIPLSGQNVSIQVSMVAIVALWALSASLEGLLYREGKSIHQVWANLIGIIALFIFSYFFINKDNVIYLMTIIWLIAFVAIIFYQLSIINKFISKGNLFLINWIFASIVVITIILLLVI